MKAAYQIADHEDSRRRTASDQRVIDRKDSRALAQFLSGEGQALLPMLELIEQAEMAASALIGTEKSFRRITGCEQLWMLQSYLDNPAESQGVAQERKAG